MPIIALSSSLGFHGGSKVMSILTLLLVSMLRTFLYTSSISIGPYGHMGVVKVICMVTSLSLAMLMSYINPNVQTSICSSGSMHVFNVSITSSFVTITSNTPLYQYSNPNI